MVALQRYTQQSADRQEQRLITEFKLARCKAILLNRHYSPTILAGLKLSVIKRLRPFATHIRPSEIITHLASYRRE